MQAIASEYDDNMTASHSSAHDLYIPGLAGIVAARTAISEVDGLAGRLTLRGYSVEELAGKANFEEAAFLLWNGRHATPAELTRFRADWQECSVLPQFTLEAVDRIARQETGLMEALTYVLSSLAAAIAGEGETLRRIRISTSVPEIVARIYRLRKGLPSETAFDAGVGPGRFLGQILDRPCGQKEARALERYWLTVIDHGMNASTFAARVIVSTGSDDLAAILGALGAMKGPLHGGAPGPALAMVREIGSSERAERFLRAKLDKGERLMGFGHRVYKVRDPRAAVLSDTIDELAAAGVGDLGLLRLARDVESVAVRLLEEYKPGRNLRTNVEFYTALLLSSLSIPEELFTPLFSAARVAGWLAHCKEQRETGRLIRPASEYCGPFHDHWPETH